MVGCCFFFFSVACRYRPFARVVLELRAFFCSTIMGSHKLCLVGATTLISVKAPLSWGPTTQGASEAFRRFRHPGHPDCSVTSLLVVFVSKATHVDQVLPHWNALVFHSRYKCQLIISFKISSFWKMGDGFFSNQDKVLVVGFLFRVNWAIFHWTMMMKGCNVYTQCDPLPNNMWRRDTLWHESWKWNWFFF